MSYKYEVAISFAGEDRPFAEAIAMGLRDAGVKVFYDNFYAAEIWGEDLSVKLRSVYHDSSEFCIMVISRHYVEKMWTIFERQQAIERLIREKGKTYVLPVRLNGFAGEVAGLSGIIGYLSVRSDEPQKVIDTFLAKVGRKPSQQTIGPPVERTLKPHVPKLKRSFSDKEKNTFLKNSFGEIIDLMEQFLNDTKKEHPHFDYDAERVTTRKAVFTVYSNQKQITQFKIWLGGAFGSNQISFLHGNRIDIENDNSMNEWISLEEHEDELKLKPIGMASYGMERDKLMSPREAAEYFWGIIIKTIH